MKFFIRDFAVLIVFFIMSFFINFGVDNFFINTLFTVSTIMFSIGLGLIVTFNLQGIKNLDVISKLRNDLNIVRNSFIRYFVYITLVLMIHKYLEIEKVTKFEIIITEENILTFDPSVFSCLVIVFSICYYIVNFICLQNLNNDVYDKTHLN